MMCIGPYHFWFENLTKILQCSYLILHFGVGKIRRIIASFYYLQIANGAIKLLVVRQLNICHVSAEILLNYIFCTM